ncbi:hypothetical protein LWI29_024374 [Acer saccharum]|uniref:Uncharacterized protein n=1 Tax=Acer saccharum TaxID=4024 RepID=A0AA39W7L3_ACESA|nr:hypothetical protein LWI29_024374 [Acer saccharum]
MKIKIKESSLAKPAQETPNKPLWTSSLDLLVARVPVPTVYFYKPNGCSNFFNAQLLKEALCKALVMFYPVAGRLGYDEKGRLEIKCNGEGVLFVEAETDSAFDHFNDFAPSLELMQLIPNVDYSGDISSSPLFAFQITSFKCGGVTLGSNMHHSLADGPSAFHFVNTWADIARYGSSTSTLLLPWHDRTLLQARNPPAPAFHHIEYDPSPSMVMNTTHLDPPSSSTCTSAVFKVSSEQQNMLKKHKPTSSSTSTGAKYSSYETLAAHIWRSICKARGLANDQLTKLYIPVDGRSRLNPPLPPGFFGNAIFSATSTALAGDIQSEPLIDTVGRIYEAVKRIDDDYIRSALDYLQVQPDLAPLSRGAQTFKCPNLNVNSWSRLPMYDADFGWGRPVFTGPPSVVLEGMCFILPKSTIDGSLSLAICLETSHMQLFKDLGQQTMLTGSAEDEATKVLAIGSVLGIDFSEVEEEVLVEIARREEEDAARFEALNG